MNDLENQTHLKLILKNFSKNKAGLVGISMTFILISLSVFAEFFSPNDPTKQDYDRIYQPPSNVYFFDNEGKFSFVPFIYQVEESFDMEELVPVFIENKNEKIPIKLFIRSWEYKLFGIISTNLHFFGTDSNESRLYLLGTDKLGRDVWGRACLSGRISLTLSVLAVLTSVLFGSLIGIISGYYGGLIDWCIQRIIEIFTALPALPLWIALAALIPPDMDSSNVFMMMIFIFSLLGWTLTAREIRGKVMSFAQTDFINAAKEIGASDTRIIFKHIFPNCLSHIIVVLSLTIPQIILSEAFLSFIGIGIQEPLTSWGFMMKNAQSIETLGSHLWILSPTFFIIFAVLGFNFLGDGIRDAVDPYSIK